MRRVIETLRRPFTKRERGQMLVIFAAIFFVTLGLGAFAVDQGMWLSKRRSAQKDADTSARGGIYALLSNPSSAAARKDAAETAGRDVADQNGVPLNANTTFAYDDRRCETAVFGRWDVPSLHVEINDPTGSLFGRVLGIDGMQDLGAQATACIGEPDLLEGIDPFYIAPGTSSPDPLCFNADGTPKFGAICPVVVSSTYGDMGQRGKLGLQDDPYANDVNPSCDPFASNNCRTLCTEQFSSTSDEHVVTGADAVCAVDDGVYTSGGTYNTQKGAIACRIFGVDDPDCPNKLDGLDQPGEGFCDSAFHDSGAQIPPFGGTAASGMAPPFTPAWVIDSPPGVDDFTEAFSTLSGDPPDSYTDPQFLIPNLCNGQRTSPRIWTIIIGEAPPGPGGVLRVKKFATFFVIGCWNQDAPGSTVLSGSIDTDCKPSVASTTNLVGIFVKAFLPKGGGPLSERCDDGSESCAILLVK